MLQMMHNIHAPDDAPDMPQMMSQTMTCPRHTPDDAPVDAPDIPLSIIFDILKAPVFKNIAYEGSFQHCTWLYLSEPGFT